MRALTFVLMGLATMMATMAEPVADTQALPGVPLHLHAARVSLDGTSNIHAFTASTHTVTIRTVELAGTPTGDVLDYVLQTGNLKGVEVTIPTRSLTSPKEGIDKNMHKALKVQEHPHMVFRLGTLQGADNAFRATGTLTIAGVEKPVALDLRVERQGSNLAVTGTTDLLMTDYGIAPPKAMLGMLKTNPKVQIRIELLLGAPLTPRSVS